MSPLRTPLKFPLLLFLITALLGVWASYNQTLSWDKFALIGASLVLYFVFANLPFGGVLEILVWLLLLGSAGSALLFATQHDFGADQSKFQFVTVLGKLLNQRIPQLQVHTPQANIEAGPLEIALPVSLALAWHKLRERARLLFALAMGLAVVIAFGLLMTSSRGAWLALAVVAVCCLLLSLAHRIFAHYHFSSRHIAPLAVIAALVAILLGLHWGGALIDAVGVISVGDHSVSRLEVYGQAAHLVKDYVYTGSGLGVFPMVFSTYVLMIDVPFLTHSHDLFLQIWIEQGILGLAAIVWLFLAFYYWVWRRRDQLNWLAIGSLAATTVMLLHGFFDVLLYSSRFLPLMFVPLALAVAAMRPRKGKRTHAFGFEDKLVVVCGVVVLASLLAIFAFAHDRIVAAWYENLGSVEQTKIELSRYHFMDSLVEYVRRDADLSPAEEYFSAALALDPGNVSANQRLASISLARGDNVPALNYAQAAEERDPQNTITRELLGEAYLGVGQIDEAYSYWSGISDGAARLERLSRVRYLRDGDNQRAAWATALASRIQARSSQ
jgi:O-antigen ligase